jgi:hypothetical protein
LTVDQGPRTVGFKLADASGQSMARYGRTEIVPNRWYHVGGVYDARSRTLDVYLNGRRDNGCLLGSITDRQRPTGGHVFVGRRARPAGYGFIGSIDEVRIQSRALSEPELRAEFEAAHRVEESPGQLATGDVEAVHSDTVCTRQREASPPRAAGPLVSLGVLIALACLGLLPRSGFHAASLGLCILVGSTASFWLHAGLAPEPAWLLPVYVVAGALVVFAASAKRFLVSRRE